jgi:hypothetical protein
MIGILGANAQNISGKIIDSKNNPVPYATLQIGDSYGVITNEEGRFTMETKGFSLQDSVQISCLGYEKQAVLLKNFEAQDYILKEHVNELSEIFLSNKTLSVDSIMYYVRQNLVKNYKFDGSTYNLFSRKTEYVLGKTADFEIDKSTGFKKRQLDLFNKDFDKLETSLINNTSKQYTDFIGELKILNETNAKLDVEKAIRLLDERNNQSFESLIEKGNDIVLKHLDKDKLYTVKSGLFKISDSVSLDNREDKMADTINSLGHVKEVSFNMIKNHSYISASSKLDFITSHKTYDYALQDVTFLNDEMVYRITFKPRRASAKYEGTIYISDDTFAVLRADYKFYKNRVGEKFNLRLLLGVKYVEKNKKGIVVYQKDEDGYYYPSYINEQIDRYFYINRPIKFIENKNRRNKVAFTFKIEGTFKEKSELLIRSRKDLNTEEYKAYSELKKIEYITPKTYDASIWQDYNVLEPLNEMKSFKVEGNEDE